MCVCDIVLISKQKGETYMEKLLNVLSQNLGYTVVLAVSAVLFFIFSDGLISGLITAVSALVAYACIVALYREYKGVSVKKTTKKSKK